MLGPHSKGHLCGWEGSDTRSCAVIKFAHQNRQYPSEGEDLQWLQDCPALTGNNTF